MATTTFGKTNFVIQAGETGGDVDRLVGPAARRVVQLSASAPCISDSPDDDWVPTAMEVTRQAITVSAVYPYQVQAYFTVRIPSPAGSEVAFGFSGLRSAG